MTTDPDVLAVMQFYGINEQTARSFYKDEIFAAKILREQRTTKEKK